MKRERTTIKEKRAATTRKRIREIKHGKDEEDEGEFIKDACLGSLSSEEVLPGVRARDKFIKAQERRA